jgi:AcrR family transcriptional regulator
MQEGRQWIRAQCRVRGGDCVRADAEANYEKVLDAAADVFVERGIDAPLTLVAQRAGVGKGTLYRHFDDRDALILGLADRLQLKYEQIAEDATSAPTGWDALVIYIDGVTAMYFDTPWMVVVRARARRLATTKGQAEHAFRHVLERAWDEGSLRTDVDLTDLAFVTTALGGLANVPESIRPVVVARLRDIILDGLRAEGVPRPSLTGNALDIGQYRHHTLGPEGEADQRA